MDVNHGALSAREILAWMAVFALVCAVLAAHFGPRLMNDSYQYLSVAENLKQHGRAATSIVHFDTERAHAVIPAPETTFPPGYSLALVPAAALGMKWETAGIFISAASLTIVTALLCGMCGILGCHAGVTRVVVAMWLLNCYALIFSRTIMSEALFTATITGAVLLLLRADETAHHRQAVPNSIWAAFFLAGASVWIRYAGLFVVVGFLAYAALLIRSHVRNKRMVAVSVALASGVAGGILLRNVIVAGAWQGGNTKADTHPFLSTAKTVVAATIQVLFGAERGGYLTFAVVFAAAALMLAGASWRHYRSSSARQVLVLLGLIGTYSTFMLLAGLRTVVSFDLRMFFPLLPLFLPVLGWIFSRARELPVKGGARVVAGTGLVVCLVSYAGANVRSILATRNQEDLMTLKEFLAEPDAEGTPVQAWINQHIPRDEPIVATDGQATSYLLHRPVISLVGTEFSVVNWTEDDVHRTMTTFGAHHVIVYPAATYYMATAQHQSPFLTALAEGAHPAWLTCVTRSAGAIVYEIRESSDAPLPLAQR